MLPIYDISIFLLFTKIVVEYTECSPQFSMFKNRQKGFIPGMSSFSRNADSVNKEGRAFDPQEIKAETTRILLFDRTKNKWVYMPKALDKWNKNGELKMIIHGFNPLTQLSGIPALMTQHVLILGREYADKNSTLNVVLVDWMPLATRPANQYFQAAENTRSVANHLTTKLMKWKTQGDIQNWEGVHLLGVSLGGHVAGMIGYQILEQTGEKIGRITGLDPAGPRFSDNGQWPEDRTEFLDYTDAEFVDILHCNMGIGGEIAAGLHGTYGSAVKAGHVDFYPNGGVRQKYTCDSYQDRFSCSHMFCVMLMAAGVKNSLQFPMCPCPSWETYLKGRCNCDKGSSNEVLYLGGDTITEDGPKPHGYYGVIKTKLSPDYFKSLSDDDIELF